MKPFTPKDQDTSPDITKELKDISKELCELFQKQALIDSIKLDFPPIELQNLNNFLNLQNAGTDNPYTSIHDVDQKMLIQVLMNFGCLYGRRVDNDQQIHLAEKNLFQEFSTSFKIPESAIMSIETPGVFAQEFASFKQIDNEKYGFHSIGFTQGISAILGVTEGISHSDTKASLETSTSKLLFGGYYYPKGTIKLNLVLKTLTEEVKKFFRENEILTPERMKEFYSVYGTHLPTEVVVGGELVRVEKLTQDIKASAEKTEFSAKVGLVGVAEAWLSTIGFRGQKKKDKRDTEDTIQQKLQFEAVGGDEKFITDVTKWMNSLENPDTWRVIRVRQWIGTHEVLDPQFSEQFAKYLKDLETNKIQAKDPFNYKFSNHILLENRAPYALSVFENHLFAFFSQAIQVFDLANMNRMVKVPAPWTSVASAVVMGDHIYVSTKEEIFRVNPKTCGCVKLLLKDKKRFLSPCLLLAYDNHLYAFRDQVLKIDPESGECEIFTSSTGWDSATCGIVKGNSAFVVLSSWGNLWQLNLDNKEEEKIGSQWGKAQAMLPCCDDDMDVFIVKKYLNRFCLKTGEYSKEEDTQYDPFVCAASAGTVMYVASRPDPYGNLPDSVEFYKVTTKGARELIETEWSPVDHGVGI